MSRFSASPDSMFGDKLRFRFAKTGSLRLLSHHDLMRCLERMLRRANLPFKSTAGFHPSPRVVFALSLPLGVAGLDEVVEIEFTTPLDADAVLAQLRTQAPIGLSFTGVAVVPVKATAMPRRMVYRAPLPAERLEAAAIRCAELLAQEKIWVDRLKPSPKRLNIRPYIRDLKILPFPLGGGVGGERPAVEKDGASDVQALAADMSLPSPPGRGAGGEGAFSSQGNGALNSVRRTGSLPPELLDFARSLRQGQTDAERLIWSLLRASQLGGWKFRRQHPVEPYVLDFYCHEARLAIELDGGQHNTTEAQQHDGIRSARLAEAGIRVIRFWNHDVLRDTEAVLEGIWLELGGRRPSPPAPLPEGEGSLSPSPLGRGVRGEGAFPPPPFGPGADSGEGSMKTPSPPAPLPEGEGSLSPSPLGRGVRGEGAFPPPPFGPGADSGEGSMKTPSPPTPLPEGEGSKRVALSQNAFLEQGPSPDALFVLTIDLWVTSTGTARVDELLDRFELADLAETGAVVERVTIEVHDEATAGADGPPTGPAETLPLDPAVIAALTRRDEEPNTGWAVAPAGPVVE